MNKWVLNLSFSVKNNPMFVAASMLVAVLRKLSLFYSKKLLRYWFICLLTHVAVPVNRVPRRTWFI